MKKINRPNKLINCNRKLLAFALIAAVVAYPLVAITGANATPLNKALLRLDNPVTGGLTGGRVCLSPSSGNATAIGSVVVTFPTVTPSGYTLAAAGAANWGINTTGLDTGQTALTNAPATTSAVSGLSFTITLTATTNLTSGTLYCFNFTSGSGNVLPVTVASACVGGASCEVAGSITTKAFTGGATMDSTNISETTVASGTPNANQVAISGVVVPPIFNFALSGNTDAFGGNLSLSSVNNTAGKNIVISTNANNGWIVWATDANNNGSGRGALKSANNSSYINPNAAVGTASRTPAGGTEDYGIGISGISGAGCTLTANTNYDSTGGATKIGTLDPTQYQQVATGNAGSNCTTTELERATISATTKAATDYADTITFVGSGSF